MSVAKGCDGCRNTDANSFAIPFTMAFQPIVDVEAGSIWGYESLVRGLAGESAFQVLSQLTPENRYAFDQACRVKAIELAGEKLADPRAKLSINFMPNAVYEPKACIRATLSAAARLSSTLAGLCLNSPRTSGWRMLATFSISSTNTSVWVLLLR